MKYNLKRLKYILIFVITLSIGVVLFNLFHLNDKLRMIQVVNDFHKGQIHNDKKLIDKSLAENFVETGVDYYVGTPDINKNTLLNFDFSEINISSINEKYLLLLNMFSNSNKSLSFIREIIIIREVDGTPSSLSFYVTYTFENTENGWKIVSIERKW